MTLLAERPATSPLTTETVSPAAGTALRGGSYVTLPAGSAAARSEGTYATVAGSRNLPPVTRGSYVTVDGNPTVDASAVEGSYVTLPAGA